MNIRALKAKLATVLGQARGITDKAAAEGRDTLSAEEQSAFDGHMAASQQLRAQITNLEALADAEAGMGTALDLGQQAQVTGTKTNVADDPKRGFKSFGEYAKAVRAGAGGRPDERLLIGAAAPTTFSNESSGGDGGFAVPPEYSREIWNLSLMEDSLIPMTDNTPINGNSMVFPQDETTPWGTDGVRAYWAAEASAATQTKVKMGVASLRLNKLMALMPITDELTEDAAALGAYLLDKGATSIRWKANEAIFQGTGAGQPQGLMNSAAMVEVAKESGQAASTLDPKNLAKMIARLPPGSYGKSVWVIGPDSLPALFTLSLGNYPIYLPQGGGVPALQGSPYGSLLGRPVMVSQHAEAFSSAGDVQLHDLSYYRTITKAGGIETATSMHLFFDAGATAFRVTFRMDGAPKLKAAISQSKGANTLSPFVRLGAR
jgi:HK97 family phage major capsid protein